MFNLSSLQTVALIVIILSLALTVKAEGEGVFFEVDENSLLLDEKIIWNGKGESLLSCSQMCARKDDCKSANYVKDEGTCTLLSERHAENPGMLSELEGSLHLQKVLYLSILYEFIRISFQYYDLGPLCFERQIKEDSTIHP